LAELEFRLLPEADAEVVTEHLSECPDCRVFNDQLHATRELLARTPTLQLTPDVADILEEAQSELADGRIEHILKGLYLVASALDVEDADELVQETLTNAISTGATLNSGELINALIRTANVTRSEPLVSLNDASDPGSSAYDPDSETAELFYPEFYEEGPDVGRFIDSPNVWGHIVPLAPEDEVATIELIEVAHSAVSALPDVPMRLITLVDIENVPFEDAARALRVPKAAAARALNEARIHVRGSVDNYLTTRTVQTTDQSVIEA
jgi:DNA-directed RNA polymerase specialized sigma24 family protein